MNEQSIFNDLQRGAIRAVHCVYMVLTLYLLVLEFSVLEGVLVFVHVVSGLSGVSVLWSVVLVLLRLWAAATRHNQYKPKGTAAKQKTHKTKEYTAS